MAKTEKQLASSRRYQAKNRDKLLEDHRQYNDENRDAINMNNIVRRNTPEAKYIDYKYSAEKRGHSFELTIEEFSSFWQKPCLYCKDSIKTIGIDRVNSSIGYTLSNCTSCCTVCNKMKLNYSKEFWINHIRKVMENN